MTAMRRAAIASLAYLAAAGSAAGGAWLALSGRHAGHDAGADGGRLATSTATAPVPFGMGGGGALFQPAISPHDPRVLFVQCDMGGVYRSTDGGAAWRLLDGRAIRAVVCEDCLPAAFAFHPREHHTLYAFGMHDGCESLLVSRDLGAAFAPLAPDPPWADAQVTALAIDPDDPKRMIAGTARGAFRTTDGGARWVAVALPTAGASTDPIRKHADESDAVIGVVGQAATWIVATRNRVARSTDGGDRWEDATAGLPAGPYRRFAAGGDVGGAATLWITAPSRVVDGALAGGVLASDDLGRTWRSAMGGGLNVTTKRVDSHGLEELPEYAFLAASPAARDTAYVSTRGNGLWPPHDFNLWRTTDRARAWTEVLLGDPGLRDRGLAPNVEAGWLTWDYGWYWGGDAYGLTVDASDARHAIVTNLGEIFETHDAGGAWRQIYTDAERAPAAGLAWRSRGIDVTSSWHVYADPFAPQRLFVAHSDIGLTRSEDGGRSWHHSVRGSPWTNSVYALAFDPTVRGRMWGAASAQHDVPHWTQLDADGKRKTGGVVFSDDGGATWAARSAGLPDAPAVGLALDPTSPADARRLWVAVFGEGVFASADGGLAWRRTGPLGGDHPHVHELVRHPGGALFVATAAARHGRALARTSGVWRSDDGGATWRSITASAPVPPLWITGFAVDPKDPARVWITVADAPGGGEGSAAGGAYATADGGATWRALALPRPPDGEALETFAPSLDPRVPARLWVTTNGHGTWESDDAGATFHELALPFRSTHRVERVHGDDGAVYVSTFGGGTWRVPR